MLLYFCNVVVVKETIICSAKHYSTIPFARVAPSYIVTDAIVITHLAGLIPFNTGGGKKCITIPVHDI